MTRTRTAWCAALIAAVLAAAPAAQSRPGFGLVEAVEITLAAQPAIRIQRERVSFSQGVLQSESGLFEPRVNFSLQHSRDEVPFTSQQVAAARAGGQTFDSTVTNVTAYRLGFDKLFRSGLRLSPFVQVTQQDVNIQRPITTRPVVSFSVSQPLLRGRGAAVVAAQEDAARLELDASNFDLVHATATRAAQTVLSYWVYVSATRVLGIQQESEARAQRLEGQMQVLIDAGNQPAALLKQIRGFRAGRSTERLIAERNLFEAREALGMATGLPAERFASLPPPTDGFPDPTDADLSAEVVERLATRAVSRRPDAQAAERRQREMGVLETAARDDLKPRLDLIVSAGHAGVDEDTGLQPLLAPFAISGFNASVALVYDWPISKLTALGQLAAREAATRESGIVSAEVGRTIRSNVSSMANQVRQGAERVRFAREAATLYASAVDDEREKLQLGLSTLIDLIQTEDRYTASRLEQVSAEFAYAQALARLRYETGTLLGLDPQRPLVTRTTLTTVPGAEGPVPPPFSSGSRQ